MSVSDFPARNMRGGKCMGDVMGAFKRASREGRAASQWVAPTIGRKVRGKTRHVVSVQTSWPTNSK